MQSERTGVRTVVVPERVTDDVVAELRARSAGRTVSVCLPCRDEAATIGPLVTSIRDELVDRLGFVDELIVLDDRSTDDTARVAERAGARVVSIEDVHAVHGTGHGKGNALWSTLLVSDGDVVVWCDGDVTSFQPDWVVKLAAPLLDDDSLAMVKARYERPTTGGGGGRTTELVARPLLSRYFPELTGLAQPLSGEYAVRRSVVEQLDMVQGWGVEVGLLVDIAARHGAAAIGQVDLGPRLHRHHDLHRLSVQAAEVMSTLLDRAGLGAAPSDTRAGAEAGPGAGGPAGAPRAEQVLRRADGSEVPLNLDERPAIAGLVGDVSRAS